MIKNYLITALRSFAKNKLITAINITGLAIGLACALLVFLFLQDELTVDRFHHNIDHLYRLIVEGESKDVGKALEYRLDVDYRVAPKLLQGYPEVTNVACMAYFPGKIDHNNQHVHENRFWLSDPHIFDLLTLPLKRGDPQTVLEAPGSVVITPAMALKYFGNEDPIGKTLKIVFYWYPLSYQFTVTGVLEPLPKASSYKIDFLAYVPFERIRQDIIDIAHDPDATVDVITFLTLADPATDKILQDKLAELDVHESYKSFNLQHMRYRIEPFKGAYLTSKATFYEPDVAPDIIGEGFRSSDVPSLFFLILLSAMMLAVSCINIINLATARSAMRAREIGVRKVSGARRQQLILQFIFESILLSYLALPIALLLTELLLPSFNTLVRRELSVNYLGNWIFLLGMVGITTLTGVLSGAYPAFILSAFKPATALKSHRLQSSIILRKGLMMIQIGVGVTVFLFALAMLDEMKALKVRDIGFNSQNLIFFQVEDKNLSKRYLAFKNEILRISGVTHVTASNFVPWQHGFMLSFAFCNQETAVRTWTLSVDTSFRETYQIPLIEGRGFRTEWVENNGRIIINETARNLLQLSGTDPLYKKIGTSDSWFWRHRVEGIMRDFCFFYPAKRMKPLALLPSRYLRMGREFITIRLAEGSHSEILAKVEKSVKRFFPRSPFEYRYVAKEMDKMHAQIMGYRLAALIFATVFSLFIAAVGLFGFATYETERCTKEIGIRKALGAKPVPITVHFILKFSRLTLTANIISWPVCYTLIQLILKTIDYPHPVRIGFTHFLSAGCLTLMLTIATVWVQTYRAVSVDPVKALRYE